MKLSQAGRAITLLRPMQTGRDEMGEATTEIQEETVDNVIWQRSSDKDLDSGERPNGDHDELIVHFPKTYTERLEGCSVVIDGLTYELQGDPVGYMDELTPGPWNRPVYARRIDG